MSIPIRKTHPLFKIINNSLIELPSPSNINSLWNFGSLLGLCLMIQILTGLFLAIHYSGDIELAFYSVNHISRDVNFGWLLRIIHANGARYLFIYSYWARFILWIIYIYTYMTYWGNNFIISNSYCFFRLCFTLRTNIFLRSYCNY